MLLEGPKHVLEDLEEADKVVAGKQCLLHPNRDCMVSEHSEGSCGVV